jgi:hypothetical protein
MSANKIQSNAVICKIKSAKAAPRGALGHCVQIFPLSHAVKTAANWRHEGVGAAGVVFA